MALSDPKSFQQSKVGNQRQLPVRWYFYRENIQRYRNTIEFLNLCS